MINKTGRKQRKVKRKKHISLNDVFSQREDIDFFLRMSLFDILLCYFYEDMRSSQ